MNPVTKEMIQVELDGLKKQYDDIMVLIQKAQDAINIHNININRINGAIFAYNEIFKKIEAADTESTPIVAPEVVAEVISNDNQ